MNIRKLLGLSTPQGSEDLERPLATWPTNWNWELLKSITGKRVGEVATINDMFLALKYIEQKDIFTKKLIEENATLKARITEISGENTFLNAMITQKTERVGYMPMSEEEAEELIHAVAVSGDSYHADPLIEALQAERERADKLDAEQFAWETTARVEMKKLQKAEADLEQQKTETYFLNRV